MFARSEGRPPTPAPSSRRRWLALALAGLLACGTVATATAGARDRPPDAPPTSVQLTAGAEAKKKTRFRVSSFNVLGHSHTTGESRFAGGRTRMERAFRILRRHRVDVVGFQELQPEQLEKFNKLTGKRWALYPAGRFEHMAMHNSIAWRTSKWKKVRADYLYIPYFKGDLVKMPVVKLRHRRTHQPVYFANFHNPADAHGDAQRWRDQARRKQIALANRIAAKRIPLVITGDMNEREKYFCNMVARAPMRAANGGHNRPGKPCRTPDNMGIDWIFGSRSLSFTDYRRVESRRVRRTTDHPFLVARATTRTR